jgi:hypothetical protein
MPWIGVSAWEKTRNRKYRDGKIDFKNRPQENTHQNTWKTL